MEMTLENAKALTHQHVTEPSLRAHAIAVSAAMGALAEHYGEDKELWEAVGYLHDIDYEKWPEEHLQHAGPILEEAGVAPDIIRAVLSHGHKIVTDIKPETNMEKALFAVDELTGLIHAAARMRPTGIEDMEVSSVMKKWKDKKFAAGCDRELIKGGAEDMGLTVEELAAIAMKGMREHAGELGLLARA